MKKNDIYEIEITGMTDEGDGVGRAENIAVFVPYTILGEIVRVIIVKPMKTYAFGKLLEVLKPSEERTKAECPYFYKCGGCQLWHMSYEKELEFKKQKVEDCIKRLGGIDTEVKPVVPSDNVSRYRNKVQMPVSLEGVGFYRKNTHQVIDMDDCLLQSEESREIVTHIREWMAECNVVPYNETSKTGDLRHIYIRSGENGRVLVLVSRTEKLKDLDKLVSRLKDLVTGIVLNVNDRDTNVVLGEKNIPIWGEETLVDNIGKTEFEISPHSFYQINKGQTYKLYSIAMDMADLKGQEVLWDLYCGIGTIGQFMASKAKKVVGVEIVPQAIENAKKNAIRNGIENAEYYCGKAENIADELLEKGLSPDVVILDPPRKGCDTKLLDTVIKAKPEKIVYISCKPSTLARDLKYLKDSYRVEKIVPVDMFPRTAHVECCVLLCRE